MTNQRVDGMVVVVASVFVLGLLAMDGNMQWQTDDRGKQPQEFVEFVNPAWFDPRYKDAVDWFGWNPRKMRKGAWLPAQTKNIRHGRIGSTGREFRAGRDPVAQLDRATVS